MNRSQLMGLDNVGIDIYDIHKYFYELTVGQRTLGFWGITFPPFYQEMLEFFLKYVVVTIFYHFLLLLLKIL